MSSTEKDVCPPVAVNLLSGRQAKLPRYNTYVSFWILINKWKLGLHVNHNYCQGRSQLYYLESQVLNDISGWIRKFKKTLFEWNIYFFLLKVPYFDSIFMTFCPSNDHFRNNCHCIFISPESSDTTRDVSYQLIFQDFLKLSSKEKDNSIQFI